MARTGTLETRVDHYMGLRGVTSTREQIREMFLETEAMEDAAAILSRRDVNASYANTGGGCMCIVVVDEPRNLIWTFGFDEVFGFGLEQMEPWESLDYGEYFQGVKAGTTPERLADIVQARLAGPDPAAREWASADLLVVDGTEGITFQTIGMTIGRGQTDPVAAPYPVVAA